jgi:hypothetical protein
MPHEITIFEIVGRVLFYLSPVIFAVGILMIVSEYKYRKLEELLGKEIGGIKKIRFPRLETTIYTFHESMLKKRIFVGLVYIVSSVLFFIVFRNPVL